ncbi:ABC transporter ATP-binding protein [Burkholderia sp. MSMB2157WGS]|uniref:ABC transporter ATP-binding protein n=1 Tax=Burkholderia sp. MSMB2157WGS TaxID=1637928 RepID=UPI00075CFCC3|nr:ABC transporter ATP-binding protein [Burkholderia sp. MSMB2157WGS]KWE59540.1 ABC transporter ATP-binding protein [Burkholderia sp. MSMB2157WGS]
MNAHHAPNPITEVLQAYWKADRWMLLAVAVVVVLSSTSAVAAPYLFSRLIDALSHPGALGALLPGFLLYAVLLGVSSALQRVVQYLAFMSAENLGFVLSTRFFARILKKTTAFFVEHNPAEIQNANARGRSSLAVLVQLGLMGLIPGVLQIVLTLVTLGALIDLEVVAIAAAYGVVAVAIAIVSARRSRAFLDRAVEAGQENARFVGGAINAMETLRHFGSHRWMNERFADKARIVRDNWRAYVARHVGYLALLGLGLAIQFAVTFWLLLPRHAAGMLSIGDIVLFNTLLLQLNQPFDMIARAIDEIARARATLVPFAAMWAAPEERQVSHASAFVPREGRVVFDRVGYAYGNGRGVTDVDFVAERGAITFVVGETGAGKSTVFKLALKSIEPTAGRILVDGVDLAAIDRADWYGAVAVVPQDVVLLNESLEDNILLGRPRDERRLREAAAKATILPFIEGLPDGFRTTVGERGLKLSGGERQRIAIARALYGEPTVLFLDEASSALDEATERDIMEHVRLLARDVTVIAITHRHSVIGATDTVVRLGGAEVPASRDAAISIAPSPLTPASAD